MLAILAGVAATMQQGRCFAKVELQEALQRVFDQASEAIQRWPIMTNMQRVKERRLAFMGYVETLAKERYPAVELVYMAERIVVDLLAMNPVGSRRELVEPLHPPVAALVAHVDAEGLHFDAMETAGEIMDALYKILEVEEKVFVS